MCLFIETLRIENGKICHEDYHNRRMRRTRASFWGQSGNISEDGDGKNWAVSDWVKPESFQARTRCRILYGRKVEKVEYFPYTPRKVERLRLVEADEVDYRYKYADRTALDRLFAQRDEADDVLIVRHGLLTDTTIANIALWNGKEWHTPSAPLLEGTCRQRLLDEGLIREKVIPVSRLGEYSRLRLFNAMLYWGEIEIECSKKAIWL